MPRAPRLVAVAPVGAVLEPVLDALLDVGGPAEQQDGDSLVTVAVRRADGDVVRVPAVLLLSAEGRCACRTCCDDYAERRRRSRFSLVG